ncbi:MAG: hypothetical protein LBG81_03685 [Coriobacteriaceae bacterium]|jgi:hypothetical protein|nr:hypothetical protein [Coriobacteriaceae bacterium]
MACPKQHLRLPDEKRQICGTGQSQEVPVSRGQDRLDGQLQGIDIRLHREDTGRHGRGVPVDLGQGEAAGPGQGEPVDPGQGEAAGPGQGEAASPGQGEAGRFCPADYRLDPAVFAAKPQCRCDTLYVAGGLYGNRWAVDSLLRLIEGDPAKNARLAVNGDAHWFDTDPETFKAIEEKLSGAFLLAGNVEAELRRRGEVGAGCGCAYPAEVEPGIVDRSNRIHRKLKATYQGLPTLHPRFDERPFALLAQVGGVSVAVVHGDERMLAGWGCSHEALGQAVRQHELQEWMAAHNIGVLATSHTCAPAALGMSGVGEPPQASSTRPEEAEREASEKAEEEASKEAKEEASLPRQLSGEVPSRPFDVTEAIINNGAAGMPNFGLPGQGLVTRVSLTKHPQALYRAQLATTPPVFVEAVPLEYDQESFLAWFDKQWPRLSPASVSYRTRIADGTGKSPHEAIIKGFSLLV